MILNEELSNDFTKTLKNSMKWELIWVILLYLKFLLFFFNCIFYRFFQQCYYIVTDFSEVTNAKICHFIIGEIFSAISLHSLSPFLYKDQSG